MPEVGAGGQARLAAARVAVVGAGGLGCAVLEYLTAAGVGHLTIVDHDSVEESNLHRQPLYRMSDLGSRKVEAARAALGALNPEVRIEALAERVTPANAPLLAAAADIVVDAADSFAATYVLSDSCVRAGKPLVSASVLGLSGYVGAFCGGAPSYRAVFPELPRQAGSCAESGVLGTAV
ncbi:MAG TPA: ThiF family adenylyltransferase, partial [Steroidobacteraceae bacterium]|nr:ThiF family adenylyltransferase [Steroidobacteraceae bacterium]